MCYVYMLMVMMVMMIMMVLGRFLDVCWIDVI